MKRLRVMLGQLTPGQREELTTELAAMDAKPVAATVVEGRLAAERRCPHCSADRVIKHGTANGLQRYKCRDCGKTFCALTGTPLNHLAKRGKWLGYAACLRDGLTLQEASERVGISIGTAFRWRHRFLSMPRFQMAQALGGIAETDETYFLRSCKGQRKHLDRPPRKRGGMAGKRGLSDEQVPVLVARDRSGATADFILEVDDSDHIVQKLRPILPKDAILCTEGNSVMMAAGRKLGVEHHAVNVAAGRRVDGPWHVQNVNSYHSRLKDWIRHFRGVATKYLTTYLGWFRAIDRSPAHGLKPAQWLAMALGQTC